MAEGFPDGEFLFSFFPFLSYWYFRLCREWDIPVDRYISNDDIAGMVYGKRLHMVIRNEFRTGAVYGKIL